MIYNLIVALVLCMMVAHSTATTYHNSGVSVQLFEWSWADVANECETFLSKKGFKAVQISPPMEHIQGSQWWTRYQPVTYRLVSRSGNETQFNDMVKRCTNVGVNIVADAVINHMAAGSGVGTAGASYGGRTFPGIYSTNDFHHNSGNDQANCQVNNYADKYNVQYCDLVGLPDLVTGSAYVQNTIANYIKDLYSRGVKGIRIDAAKHQDAGELAGITKQLPSDMYIGTEVIGATGEAVQPNMYYGIGQVSEFYYADNLDTNIINQNKMIYLQTFGEAWGMMPDQYAAVFLDNHDTQRNGRAQLTYKNGDMYTFANVFMLAWPYGNTRVMSSYYFTDTDQGPPSVGVNNGANCHNGRDWVCEHRITAIANMVAWRNAAGTSDINNWQVGNSNQIAFGRGNGKTFIAMNRDSNTWYTQTLSTSMPEGTYCNVIVDDNTSSCSSTVTVNSSGQVTLQVPPLSAVAFHVNAKKN